MIRFNWVTADACGGSSYGPYSRKQAFKIQRDMQHEEQSCERQDVFFCMYIIRKDWQKSKEFRLIKFKGHYVQKR